MTISQWRSEGGGGPPRAGIEEGAAKMWVKFNKLKFLKLSSHS